MSATKAARRRPGRTRALEDPSRDRLPTPPGSDNEEHGPRGHMKIETRTWIDDDGRRVGVAEIEPSTFTAVYLDDDSPRWPLIDHMPSANFHDAQLRLDNAAHHAGWTPDPPLPPEDDPEPKPASAAAESAGPTLRVVAPGRSLPVDRIAPSPFQPRKQFPEQVLRAMAESLKSLGQLQPILVRVRPKGGYELLDGERRLRAAKLAGLTLIQANIAEATDRQAREVVIASAVHREDLTAIEKAHALQALIDAGDVAGVTEAAQRVGMSQGHASNLLNLLDLPAEWQARIESGELPPTHARALLPHRGRPAVLKAVASSMKYHDGDLGTVRDFDDEVARQALQVGRELHGTEWDHKTVRSIPRFKPTEEERAALDVIEVNRWGRKCEVAMNAKLWDQRQAAWRKEFLAKPNAKERKGEKPKTGGGKPARPPTKAELEAAKKREAERLAQAKRQTARKTWTWKIDRLRQAIADALYQADWPLRQRVWLWLLVSHEGWWAGSHSQTYNLREAREELLEFVCRTDTVRFTKGATWTAIAALSEKTIADRLLSTVAECLWSSQHGPQVPIPDDVVLGMAEAFQIDIAQLWKTDQKQAAGLTYFEHHTREQLVELSAELKGPHLDPSKPKSAMVALLQKCERVLPLPKALAAKRRPA